MCVDQLFWTSRGSSRQLIALTTSNFMIHIDTSSRLREFFTFSSFHFSLPFVRTVNTILKVRLGEYDVSTTAEPLKHEEFNISDIVIHPGFNNSTLVHDIALLRLEKPAKRKQVRSHQDSVIPKYRKVGISSRP